MSNALFRHKCAQLTLTGATYATAKTKTTGFIPSQNKSMREDISEERK